MVALPVPVIAVSLSFLKVTLMALLLSPQILLKPKDKACNTLVRNILWPIFACIVL